MNMLTVLREIKHALETSNNDDLIVDTLWMAHGRGDETLFDYIDQQIENAEREKQEFDAMQGYAQKDITATEQAQPAGFHNAITQLQRQLDAECADNSEQRRMKVQAREQRDKMTKALMELVRDLAANGGTASPEALARACEVTKIPMPEKRA